MSSLRTEPYLQANVYDASRRRLLCGREDMLALAAAQLKFQKQQGLWGQSKPIWVDVSRSRKFNVQTQQC